MEGPSPAQGLLHIGDEAHGGVAVGPNGNGELAAGIVGHLGFLLLYLFRQLLQGDDAVVELDAGLAAHHTACSIDGAPDEQIEQAGATALLQMVTLWNCVAHLRTDIAHVGDQHEKEKHREDEVGHGSQVQGWHGALLDVSKTGHGR